MERRMKEWVAQSLKEYERRSRIATVLEMRSEPASAVGDNYMSVITRLSVDVMTKGGELETRSVIVKSHHDNDLTRELVKSFGVFRREIWIFKEVLPLLEKFRKQYTPWLEPTYPVMYGSSGQDVLLLEDLKEYGYKLAGEREGLDLDHCKLVMDALARHHAVGAILLERGDLFLDDSNKYVFEEQSKLEESMIWCNFEEMAWILENNWKGECLQYAERLRNAPQKIIDLFKKNYVRDPKKFLLLNHGDCWMNNMMFRYTPDGKPASVRLIDYQIPWYNTPGFDLNYFMWTSCHTETRDKKDELVDLYYKSLTNYLSTYGYKKEAPSREEILADVKEKEVFGFTTGLCFLPFMMLPRGEIPDFDQLSKNISGDNPTCQYISRSRCTGEAYRRTTEHIIKEGVRLGII